MAIAVADDDDEDNHCNQPPTKRPGTRIVSRDQDPENGNCEENKCEGARERLKDNMPIPAQAYDANATGAKKVIRIKAVADPEGKPEPKEKLNQGEQGH